MIMKPDQIAIARKTGLGLTLREMTWIGKVFYKSGMFTDTRDEAVAIVKIMAGQEMGLAPFESMTGINIIKSRPTLSAATIGAKIKASPKYDYRVKVATELKNQIDFYEIEEGKRILIGSSIYTIEQAQKAGLLGKDNWKTYPEDMLFARNISRGSRRYTPDVFTTPVYIAEEIEENSPGGLSYMPEDGGHKAIEAKAETVIDPPESDDGSVPEEEFEPEQEPTKQDDINIMPVTTIDWDYKQKLTLDLQSLELSNIDEKRIIKEATGKIVTKSLSNEGWRQLRFAVDKLIEERKPNTLEMDR